MRCVFFWKMTGPTQESFKLDPNPPVSYRLEVAQLWEAFIHTYPGVGAEPNHIALYAGSTGYQKNLVHEGLAGEPYLNRPWSITAAMEKAESVICEWAKEVVMLSHESGPRGIQFGRRVDGDPSLEHA